ncbi:MAG TPA: hypothetical protein VI585_24475, partial [Candidatus Binatia bacterium]
ASGADALYSNTTGQDNTASGVSALYSNTTGPQHRYREPCQCVCWGSDQRYSYRGKCHRQ